MDKEWQGEHCTPDLDAEFEIWGYVPVQAVGTVCGREFCFCARHTQWEFEVADENGNLPSAVGVEPIFHRHGKHPNASNMPLDEASQRIEQLLREYVGSVRS